MVAHHLFHSFLVPVVLVLVGCGAVASADKPLHEKETAAAWEAFNKGNYEEAIEHANICIKEFKGDANRRQKEIDDNKETIPNGQVDDVKKETILGNGPLNDVATCYYIKARAADKLKQKEEVANALDAAATYPAARAWSPKGWFWSPAQTAELFRTHPALADKAPHEAYTALAWEAFKKRNYAKAIERADACIKEFKGDANRRQKEIDENKETIPNGQVDDAQKEATLSNGPLNDVATCYYIKARAADKLGQKEEVANALTAAATYSAARAWDPKGWFWSQAQKAELFRTHPKLVDNAPHEAYTALAWEAFKDRRHAKAIELADRCVQEFYKMAAEKEKDLVKRGIRPPTGKVNEATKTRILGNGVLNDVATCLFIKGEAATATGDKEAAAAAYNQASKLTRGRCWDPPPNGWFWSPADRASDRLNP